MAETVNFAVRKAYHLRDRAYETIKTGICDGSIEPGTLLSESQIAGELGMSRTPVREALKTLEAEGFIDIRVGVGAIVRQISYKEILDLYEVRRALEILAARTAIGRITEEQIRDLEERFRQLLKRHRDRETIGLKEFVEIDLALHRLIVEACDNHYVKDLMTTIMGNVQRLQMMSFRSRNDLEESTNQHLQILELIRAGRYEPLAEALDRHIDWSIDCIRSR